MADQPARLPFRFRLPWFTTTTTTAPPAPRPPAAPSSRPPFRPPGVAPPRSTTTSFQAQPRNESRPPSPAKIIPSQSRPSSSPIRTAPQPRVASRPPSPSNSGQSPPQPTFQPPARTGSQPPSPSLLSPKPQLPPSPSPTSSKSQADETSQNPTSLSRVSTQQEAETQKSTISQLIKSPKSPSPQPPRSSESPPTTVATTSEPPPPQNLQPEMNIPKPQDKIIEEKPIGQPQQEEKAPIPVVDERNHASQLEHQGKVSDSNLKVLASEEEEKKLKKAAPTNVHPVPIKEIRDNISKFAQRISDHPENITDENSVSVVTLTGENTGATMKLGSLSERNESKIHIHRGYKLGQEDVSEATTDGENNNPKRKSKGILGFMWFSIIINMIQ